MGSCVNSEANEPQRPRRESLAVEAVQNIPAKE